MLLSAEDDPARTIVPRLQAAGADLERIRLLCVRAPDGSERPPTLPDDCDLLHDAITESAARLVVVDPLLAFLSAGVCSLNDQHVRGALDPLARLAAATGAAILLVRHLTKTRRGRKALQRGLGATAIIGAARTAFVAGQSPDDAGLQLLACTKNNLAAVPPTLAYRLVADAAGPPTVAWEGPVTQTADDVVIATAASREEPIHEAMTLLDDLLVHGPVARETILRHTRTAGIADRTLQRAKAALGIQSEARYDRDQKHNVWYWTLPPDTATEQLMEELREQEEQMRSEAGS